MLDDNLKDVGVSEKYAIKDSDGWTVARARSAFHAEDDHKKHIITVQLSPLRQTMVLFR
jgi:hypothetical protein